ncbi:hypothetical protein [Bradyrhizobium cytisi]|uniref:Uncharacterized protein n=1 Tax=Bradyrhizobium cytisi TaxID=515489 RepID=A0A5S4WZZ1_9BRAD|nr:hypothetical protein [Bradyrhizobium cytisi]TYL87176.1 hypothetical protein FXB38_05075 [Bradyrhizobium cytisi]
MDANAISDDLMQPADALRATGTRVSVVGSFVGATLPLDIGSFVRDGVCVDPRNHTPMEMDAYSLYLALKALEQLHGVSFRKERTLLARAVMQRMLDCDGFWSHGAWTGSPREVHMRFTAAAIRLLTEAQADDLGVPAQLILDGLKRHLGYSEKLTEGTWFLHDSLEVSETQVAHPYTVSSNRAFGSSPLNCLVLNTHADTLLTILYVLTRAKDVGEQARLSLMPMLTSGLAALKLVLQTRTGISWRIFSSFDSTVRTALFRTYKSDSSFNRLIKKLILRLYFPLRHRLRSRLPAFAFPDGYTERDISLLGTAFEYHLVNLYDLSRLTVELKRHVQMHDPELIRLCETLIDRGLDYAIRGQYWNYLIAAAAENTRPILLCETIIARLDSLGDLPPPDHWIKAYCQIRRLLPPTPALLGYDPVVVQFSNQKHADSRGTDIVLLHSGKRLEIDYMAETLTIEPTVSATANEPGK